MGIFSLATRAGEPATPNTACEQNSLSPDQVLHAAENYYGDATKALAYLQNVRQARGVSPLLLDWAQSFPPAARVLELGFGPGIELAYLVGQGYVVDGVDISAPMAEEVARHLDEQFTPIWRAQTQIHVSRLQSFRTAPATYDRIWASATFLHLEKSEIPRELRRYAESLRPGGEMYLSFKMGTGPTQLDREGRPFSHYDAAEFRRDVFPAIADFIELNLIRETGGEADHLGRPGVRWLEIYLRRPE